MRLLRDWVDRRYDKKRDGIFSETHDDPKEAHRKFVKFARRVDQLGLSGLLLDCPENRFQPIRAGFEISNAAGFNKDGDIPPRFLNYLGFDRVVVGTVTGESFEGNKGKGRTIWRYPSTESMVNWEGLPGVGARGVRENLDYFGRHEVPLTINLMATPGKKGDEVLEDLRGTVCISKTVPELDRFELNISCPNTHSDSGELDARGQYQNNLAKMLGVVEAEKYSRQELWVKVSPDMGAEDIADGLDVLKDYNVKGFVATNTTTEHDIQYILSSPEKGGASGRAVAEKSWRIQEMLYNREYEIIAVGGIDSPEVAIKRTAHNEVKGIQIYTPLIYKGPRLLRQLRSANL